MPTTITPHSSHWGAFDAVVEDGTLIEARPYPGDPNPSSILANFPDAVRSPARISQPMIRKGWLDNGPGPSDNRGADPFVPVSWETATELLATELDRVYSGHGPESVFGGSYGWASAGRFHHAQGQLHRFLNTLGGYVDAHNTYSNAAGEVILDRVVGGMRHMFSHATAWPVIAEHTELIVSFGGMAVKNTDVAPGGATRHTVRDHLRTLAARGVAVELFSPIRDDIPDYVDARWHPLRPGTDVAVMLGLAHTLVTEGLHDPAFLDRYTTGFDTLRALPPRPHRRHPQDRRVGRRHLRDPRRDHPHPRPPHGELAHPDHRLLVPAARRPRRAAALDGPDPGRHPRPDRPPRRRLRLRLRRHGLHRRRPPPPQAPRLPPGQKPLQGIHPRRPHQRHAPQPRRALSSTTASDLTYPDIKLVYWVGGNPFHHHQDLARLRRAFARPDTIVVHDPFWTPTARHADIVLPATVTLERNDIGATSADPFLIAMHRAIPPFAQARDDYQIFSDLAAALGKGDCFTEGRDEMPPGSARSTQTWADRITAAGESVPTFDDFWQTGYLELPYVDARHGPVRRLPRRPGRPPASHRRPARSRSAPPPSPASTTPTAPATPPG